MNLDPKTANFRRFANAIPQLVWSTSPEGAAFYANSRFIEYTGYDIADKNSLGWMEVLHPDDRLRVHDLWTKALHSGHLFEAEYRMRSWKGVYRWFLGRATPIRGTEGEIIYWTGTSTDIDDRKKMELSLLEAKTLAENANQAKTVFLANMSHEIRSPLTAVLGLSELIADPSLPESERQKSLSAIRKNAAQLSQLIDEILDLSKVESKKLELHMSRFSVRDFVDEILEQVAGSAEKKGLKLLCRIPDDLPWIEADQQRLRQVLLNLVGNAIKYTDEGEVLLNLQLEPANEKMSRVYFQVSDTGPGIPEASQNKIFAPFTQASPQSFRGGAGLGLALAKSLMNAMGGDLRLEFSAPTQGSRFGVALLCPHFNAPKETSPKSDSFSKPSHNDPGFMSERKILVVDDAEDNRFLLSWILKKMGAEVETAENGDEALKMLEAQNYDVVLMDIQMPEMDGFTACRLARARGYNAPIVALTAYAMQKDREACLSQGFDEYLSKPIDPQKLQKALRAMMN